MKNDRVQVRIDEETKQKAICILKCKGKSLSKAVREMIEKLANEYDKTQKNSK